MCTEKQILFQPLPCNVLAQAYYKKSTPIVASDAEHLSVAGSHKINLIKGIKKTKISVGNTQQKFPTKLLVR